MSAEGAALEQAFLILSRPDGRAYFTAGPPGLRINTAENRAEQVNPFVKYHTKRHDAGDAALPLRSGNEAEACPPPRLFGPAVKCKRYSLTGPKFRPDVLLVLFSRGENIFLQSQCNQRQAPKRALSARFDRQVHIM